VDKGKIGLKGEELVAPQEYVPTVLACVVEVQNQMMIYVPEHSLIREPASMIEIKPEKQVKRTLQLPEGMSHSPLVQRFYLKLSKPSRSNQLADSQRLCDGVQKQVGKGSVYVDISVLSGLPDMLRSNQYKVTATVLKTDTGYKIVNVEGGDTSQKQYMVVIDVGTTTIMAHLLDTSIRELIHMEVCFNCQSVHGSEVTRRMIAAEKNGAGELQQLVVKDINSLIDKLCARANVQQQDILAVVCAGNTVMTHFLYALPTAKIRRSPYIPVAVNVPVIPAEDVGIAVNPHTRLFCLPAISGWVGSDITSGVLATGLDQSEEISLLMDIGTNGEIVIGNKEWMVACSASAGPALEGASVACGMQAQKGAVERVWLLDEKIAYSTIGGGEAQGMCGSGIIDLVAVLLKKGIISRSGKFVDSRKDRFQLTDKVYINESDIENIITAKAAIFAAMRILLRQLHLTFNDIDRFFIAGAFGKHINKESAVLIGLLPPQAAPRLEFVGNTAIGGATLVALSQQAQERILSISKVVTYFDLMAAESYVDEFKQAMFLPHTNIEEFVPQGESDG
jgi:uncharacterized 2Fe-2S/4Fe-4S cluster protein (DUF4445 family)